jgi:hypothetical protein
MHGEAQPGCAVALELLEGVDMQRTAARTGLELGLELADAQLRQRQPLAPAQCNQARGDQIRHRVSG